MSATADGPMEALGRDGHRPQVAVVGMACRLPGADGPDAFWRLLREGRDVLSRPEPDRGEAAVGVGAAARRGGFLDDVAGFDPAFFGISPREAAAMDPQQRLMLELGWEAMEHAGTVPATLRGSRTGVFVGAMWDDYSSLTHRHGTAAVTAHTLTGGHRGMIANRLSYTFGLTGPSLCVDTGQSSSLAAVHLAIRGLRSGECTAALVGGVNLNLLPERVLSAERLGALSPDGTCHTFDARANGYARGEGGVCLLLKPLAQARADGDRVYAVLLGSAVNNDGGGPGLTVPDQRAQAEVLRDAYRDAGVRCTDVRYVELHGTGTQAGDPVEAAALSAVLGGAEGRAEPVRVGSVKTNIGHLEGAAGLAGLLKVVLCLTNDELVPSLNFRHPPAGMPLDEWGLRVQPDLGPWPAGRRLAGVSAWGMGGTNCHVAVAAPPDRSARRDGTGGADSAPLLLSAGDRQALQDQAARLRDHLAAHPGLSLPEVAAALLRTRTVFPHRAVLLGGSDDVRAALAQLAVGEPAPAAVTGVAADTGATVFVFPGQGAQWDGMAVELFRTRDSFRRSVTETAAALDPYLDWSLVDVVTGRPGAAPLDRVDVVQPVLFAMMIGLTAVWHELGVRPDAVVGHSQGEIAAAYVAGALSLDDAARVVALRSRALLEVAGTGHMVSVGLPSAEVAAGLADHGAGIEIAAINGPGATVVSGGRAELAAMVADLTAAGVRTRWIPVDYASHSAAVETLREPLTAALAGISARTSRIAFYSTVTAGRIDGSELDADYWYRNLRQPVRLVETVERLLADGYRTIVEPSAHTVLLGPIQETADAAETDVVVVGSLRRGAGGWGRLLDCAAAAHVQGVPVRWDAVIPAGPRPPVRLPTYPFQRRRYWLDTFVGAQAGAPTNAGPAAVTPPPDGSAAVAPAESGGRRGWLRAVRTAVAGTLGHRTGDDIAPDRTFKELGLDSAMAVELGRRLTASVGVSVSPALIFDCPTPARLARRLEAGRKPAGSDAPTPPRIGAGRPGPAGEAVAIVGMACRYPGGADTPEKLWQLLYDGREDAITPFPDNRGWDLAALFDPDADRPGTTYVRTGGFLHEADQFDAGLFGVSAREARAMDPQQRLLLHVGWEAVERSGIDAHTLRETRTGVFVGAMSQQYGPRLSRAPHDVGGHLLTGSTVSVVSGRLAYHFGLRGPALTVDTACSSSLVALHLARQSLLSGECDLALVGGVCLMSDPGMFTEFSRQRGLAPDGRCKPFAAAADGTVWAEGAAVVVLERAGDARRHGRAALGLVRGTAVNSDGASNGLTAPNGHAQERVIRDALRAAALDPTDVDVVEAHGTGTRLGDPIEAGALLRVYGPGRPDDRPLLVGSLKSVIGHTQAAAGLAGVISTVMAMRHGVVPATLHVAEPSPFVDWDSGAVRICTGRTPWPVSEHSRRAGVSSFGISGTNAHVIIEQPPAVARVETRGGPPRRPLPWVLSGHDAAALAAGAGRLAAAAADLRPLDVAYTLARGRAALSHRAVAVGTGPDDLCRALTAMAAGESPASVLTGTAGERSRPVFVFPGQGSQWVGMAVRLAAESSVFAESLAACEVALAPFVSWSLGEVLVGAPGAPSVERVDVVQPVLFAVMVSLAALWRSVGVVPAAVVGHSQGEIAAACVVGALSLEDAARVVALRSRALTAIAGRGGMASVALSAGDAAERLRPWDGRLCVAAVNAPASVVVAGDVDALDTFLARLADDGVRVRRIAVDYASHSGHVTALRDTLLESLGPVTPLAPHVPMYSTVTGEQVGPGHLDAAYWFENLRRTVRFAPVIEDLAGRGFDLFIEVSPHPVVLTPMREILDEVAPEVPVLATLRRDEGDLRRFTTAMAEAAVCGAAVDWSGQLPGARVDLPFYAFQRERYWLMPAGSRAQEEHPLLTAAVPDPETGAWTLLGAASVRHHPWLADHTVAGSPLLPGSVVAELALRAAERFAAPAVDELVLQAPVPLTDDLDVQLRVGAPDDDGRRTLRFFARRSQAGDERPWARFADGVLAVDPPPAPTGPPDTGAWPPAGAVPVELSDFYDRVAEAGVGYGPIFRGVRAVWRLGADVVADVELPATADAGDDRWTGPHPALLDAVLQVHEAALAEPADQVRMPFSWQGLRVYGRAATSLRVHLAPGGNQDVAVTVTDQAGSLILAADSFATRVLSAAELPAAAGELFRPEWTGVGPRDIGTGDGAVATLHAPVDLPANLAQVPETVVLSVPGCDDGAVAESVHRAVSATLASVQAWLRDDRCVGATLVVAVRDDPAGAAVRGLVRTAQAEHPGRFVILVTGTANPTDEEARAAAESGEPELLLRDGVLHALRLTPVPQRSGTAVPWHPDGTVLVTGAGGGLVPQLARHLVTRHGIRHLLLAGRRGPAAPGTAELVAELAALGASATVVACDVADAGAVRALVAAVPAEHPLTGVVHAAAVLDDGTVAALRPEQVRRVLRAKVDGALHLHAATAHLDLAAFVLFSSASGLFGGAGQAGYAAANAALDGLARRRRADGLPALSLAWGLWQEREGMAGRLGEVNLRRDQRLGFREMVTSDALALFDAALTVDEPVLAPMNLDLAVLRGQAMVGELPAILRGLVPAGRRVAGASGVGLEADLLARLGSLPEEDQHRALEDLVCRRAAEVLGTDRPLPSDRAFRELGYDSLTALELRNRLGVSTGLRLPATLVFDHPTPAALADHLRRALTGGTATDEPPDDEAAVRRLLAAVPLAGLRRAGLLDPLLRLAGEEAQPPAPDPDALAGLALDELIDIALDGIEP